jgi:hypothetical protein
MRTQSADCKDALRASFSQTFGVKLLSERHWFEFELNADRLAAQEIEII